MICASAVLIMPPTDMNNNNERLKIVLCTIILNVTAVVLLANVPWSDWRTGMALNLVDNAILVTYALARRDRLMIHLICFGLALGFTELAADAWLVDHTKTLDYSIGGGPILVRSPLWMPFAWEVVAVQFAVLGSWLVDRFRGWGIWLAGIIGAINIPFYEEMALKTKWWSYQDCRMFLHTPYYIILGEFFIVLAIVLLARRIRIDNLFATVIYGATGGAAIWICYAAAFGICESRI